MYFPDLDLAALTLAVSSLLGRKHFYRYMFPGIRHKIIDNSITKKTTFAVIIIMINLFILLAETMGLFSTRSFWIALVATGAPAMICLPFFIGREISLIKEKRWTTL
jgi:hypothetical protein